MTSSVLPISATVLTKNSERHLVRVLDALRGFDEVVVLDNGSQDNTLAIAGEYANVSIYHHVFEGFGKLKNRAAAQARNGWIMNIDSDEIVSDELMQSLQLIDFSEINKIYTVSRLNHYRGRPIRGCGWYPDMVPRLYHRSHTVFSDVPVHERIEIQKDSQLTALSGELLHYSYNGAGELLAKMQFYSDLYAERYRGKKSATTAQAVAHGVFAFLKSYVFKKGFLYGGDGWVISASVAANSYYKYVKLKEANEQPKP
ncbi:glycosyltransferase family 2 protein [Conchiformibius steedae]|uniref:Glycosyltransferase family 2 protein n=1 Tax=Conchiformibius steedae TaxID=153493 RepID=A0A3P2A3H6_9NEIS|nr:glycosyltransferase family 2 protein [Conchiformibius steedae]RRD89987.1 glycosyltransferase family 2 protein [Conchiformibius steedae]